MVRLGDVCQQVSGVSASFFKQSDEFQYLDIASIDRELKRINGSVTMRSSEAPSRAKQPVIIGDILVSTVRPNLNAVALVKNDHDGAIASSGFCVLRPFQNHILSEYLFFFTRTNTFVEYLNNLATGASYPAVSDKIVKSSQIPLPPLPEQQRIVARLDKAQRLIDQRKEQLTLMDALVQSLFYEMFGDPVKNEKGWKKLSLLDACDTHSGGTPSKANMDFWKGNLPWFSPKDLKKPDLWNSQDHINENVPEITSLRLLPENTVVIVVRGMILAHTFPVCILRVKATINQDMKALLPKVELNSNFLAMCLRAQAGFALQQVSEAAHGTKRLDSEGLKKIAIILPPLPLQQTFADRVQQIETLKQSMTASLRELEHNFNALMQQTFEG